MANAESSKRSNSRVCPECRKTTESQTPDYYWRDYVGTIPHDALPGGLDLSHRKTYIGQAYLYKYGVLPGTIYPQNPENICVGYGSPSGIAMKVLCSSNHRSFSWERATNQTLHSVMIGKQPVIGGYENNKMVYIGRAKYQGEEIVGKVSDSEAENANFAFVHQGKEICVSSYEVLVYIR